MKAEDNCKIEMHGKLDDESAHSFQLLYAPLIGQAASQVYQLLSALANARRPITNHLLICKLTGMSIDRFEKERQVLERYLLLKTFLDPKTNEYLYCVELPKSGNAFLRHEVFGRLYLRQFGKDAYEFAKLYFAKDHRDKHGYVDLTVPFALDDPTWLQSSSPAFISLRPQLEEVSNQVAAFDFDRFLKGFERRFPFSLQTKENLTLIGELATVHGIDEMEMRKLVNQCINPRTKVFNKELLKKKARAKGRVKESIAEDPYQAAPIQFFKSLQPNIPISASDSRLIESLLVDYHLPKEVVNVLIEHVLKRSDQSFGRSYVEKIAGTWARLGIDTYEKAKAQADKEMDGKPTYVKQQKELPAWYAETEDDSIKEVEDHVIKELQQKLNEKIERYEQTKNEER